MTARVREALDLVQLGELGRRARRQALRRPAAARGSRPRASSSPPRSSSSTSRCRTSTPSCARDARRAEGAPAPARHHLGLRHPRSRGGARDLRPDRRDAGRRHRAGGTPGEIYDRPRNTFVADFVGSANLIRGRRRPDLERDGLVVIQTAGGALVHGTATRPPGAGRGPAGRPDDPSPASIARARPAPSTCGRPGSAGGCSRATSRSTMSSGTAGSLIVRSAASEPMAEGDEVFVSADPRFCVLLEGHGSADLARSPAHRRWTHPPSS